MSEERAGAANWDDVVRDLRARPSRADGPPEHRGRHRGSRPRSGRRGPRKRTAIVVGVGLVVVLVAVAWSSRAGPAAPVAPPAERGWADVLSELDTARVRALSAADLAGLSAVDVTGSAASRTDADAVRRLRQEGVRPRGLTVERDTVGVIHVSGTVVRLRVVDRRSAYALVDGAGRVVRSVAARGPRAWSVELHASGQDWRIAVVRPIGGPVPAAQPSASAVR